jgi:hypothetical protein
LLGVVIRGLATAALHICVAKCCALGKHRTLFFCVHAEQLLLNADLD